MTDARDGTMTQIGIFKVAINERLSPTIAITAEHRGEMVIKLGDPDDMRRALEWAARQADWLLANPHPRHPKPEGLNEVGGQGTA